MVLYTHSLKHQTIQEKLTGYRIDKIGGEKRGYSQPNIISNNSIKSIDMKGEKKRDKCWLLTDTSNNSMKTHLLKHINEIGREKNILTAEYIKQFNENLPSKV